MEDHLGSIEASKKDAMRGNANMRCINLEAACEAYV
jgi:hypothetical protein